MSSLQFIELTEEIVKVRVIKKIPDKLCLKAGLKSGKHSYFWYIKSDNFYLEYISFFLLK